MSDAAGFTHLKKPEKVEDFHLGVAYWIVMADEDITLGVRYLANNLDDGQWAPILSSMNNLLLNGKSWSFKNEYDAHRAGAKYYWYHKANYPYSDDFANAFWESDPAVNNVVKSEVMEF